MIGLTRPKKIEHPKLSRPVYLGRHPGRDFLVLGSGPSLGQYHRELDQLIRERDLIVMGANHITPFMHPHYHAFVNRHRFHDFAKTIDPAKSRILLGPHLPQAIIRFRYRGPYEVLMFRNDPDAEFDIRDGVIQCDCRSVSVLSIGVAIVMGARRIFVAGIDGFRRIIAEGAPTHHTDTPLEFPPEQREAFERYYLGRTEETARALRSLRAYMVREGLEPFAMVTPTDYDEYYQDIRQFVHATKEGR
ncbi:MAG: hypothetical protein HY599_02785 [Candidatus Omnitrophica bacterium]|nr:hypothetical protein [Candidatus Omnitrophota bacterium]